MQQPRAGWIAQSELNTTSILGPIQYTQPKQQLEFGNRFRIQIN